MSDKKTKLKARLPRGLGDRGPAEIAATRRMVATIQEVYERYGFEPVETPAIEFTDALGKFLPDLDRPNEGVFSFKDDDEQWLSLRYDLTAPLARYFAENADALPRPYRSYRFGWVFRNEKPGPGRFRQFMQFDADTVGSGSPAADAEICMMAADTMEALGFKRGEYIVKVNNRKVLDGVLESIGLGGDENAGRRLTVLRAIDKLDKFPIEEIEKLLGEGRKDESGDYTKGAGLDKSQMAPLLRLLKFNLIYGLIQDGSFEEVDAHFPNPFFSPPGRWNPEAYPERVDAIKEKALEVQNVNPSNKIYDYSFGLDLLGEASLIFEMNNTLAAGLRELANIEELFQSAKYVNIIATETKSSKSYDDPDPPRVVIDLSVVRGLEYYTGPVFEVELLLNTKDEKGRPVRFGSVGGGGRYDGLVSRFRGEPVPATGFSIGVSRLQAALALINKDQAKPLYGPVVVTVFGGEIAQYQKMVATLRNAGIRAELYLGNPKHSLGQQMKYADKRNSPVAIIQGSDEKAKGEVLIKDLIAGAQLGASATEREDYLKAQAEAQFSAPEADLVDAVRKVLVKHGVNWT